MGISPRDHREVVDEGRLIIADALDDATTKAMLADFADHRWRKFDRRRRWPIVASSPAATGPIKRWRKRSTGNPGSSSSSRSTGGSL
jgi:hypothetical protein